MKSTSAAMSESTDKKRESRKSGFFNLIKSRTSRSEKSHGSSAITPPQPGQSNTNNSTHTSTTSPVTEDTPPTSPTLYVKTPAAAAEPQETHSAQSPNHTDPESEAPQTFSEHPEERENQKMENKENLEKTGSPPQKENTEKKENTPIHRHIGVPVMGKDLMAEMKARQGKTRQDKMAEKKSDPSPVVDRVDSDKQKTDVHPAVSTDPEECKPEPIPRAKPPSVTPKPAPPQIAKPPLVSRTSGTLSPTSPTPCSISVLDDTVESPTVSVSPKAPLPAPRLKRAPSEQDRESTSSGSAGLLSPLEGEFPADGDTFDQPSITGTDEGISGRQWSSLKSSSSPPSTNEEERERTKSLPNYVRLPSQTDTDMSPADSEVSTLSSDLKSNNKSEDESGDDIPSM